MQQVMQIQMQQIATCETNFLFNGKVYNQIDGVAMGCLLAPVLANLFMGNNEKLWTENFQGTPPSYYRRNVDDISSVFNIFESNKFFNYINTRHHKIKFTMEAKVNEINPFLDVLIDSSQNILKTLTYHKSTYSGLLLNYTSFTSRFYKIGLIKCLTDRTYKINNTGPGFHDDVSKINKVLKRNFYPLFILDKIIKAYTDRIYYNSNKVSFEVNKLHYFEACVCYFSLFLKEQCVFWLFRTKYFERKFNLQLFYLPTVSRTFILS